MTFAPCRSSLALAFAFVLLMLVGCEGKPAAPSPAPAPKSSASSLTIGYSQCNRGEPWREQMDKDIVAELRGLSSSTPAAEGSEPFRKAIEGTDIKVVYDADMEWLGDKAREKMQAALATNPQASSINLVYGANDPAAIAAYYAAK